MKYIGFIISLIALFVAGLCYSCKEYDSSTGVFMSFIAVCATIIVGVHFIYSWTVYKMNERVERLAHLEDEVKQLKEKSNIAMHLSWALSFVNWRPEKAIKECWKAFELSIKTNDAERAHTTLNCLKDIINNVPKGTDLKLTDIINPTEEIQKEPLYEVFCEKVENIKEQRKITIK